MTNEPTAQPATLPAADEQKPTPAELATETHEIGMKPTEPRLSLLMVNDDGAGLCIDDSCTLPKGK